MDLEPIGVCPYHGFYRGERCPKCGRIGMQIMTGEEADMLSRRMTAALRHSPERFGLNMDKHGWVKISDLSAALRRIRRLRWVKPTHVIAVALTDPKGRYHVNPDKGLIRASYGHTIEIDISDYPDASEYEFLYYPATEEEIDIILLSGLKPSERTLIHLSTTLEQAISAGRVHTDDPIILTIDVRKAMNDGVIIKKASPYICIAKEIPPKYISILGKASEIERVI